MTDTADCVFCRILRGELPSDAVYEDDHVLVFRDIKPAAPVHLLVIPKTHIPRLSDCGPDQADVLARVMLAASEVARQENLESFRLIINDGAGAGQTVFHLHAHILAGAPMGERLL